jgi:hypothetical protein
VAALVAVFNYKQRIKPMYKRTLTGALLLGIYALLLPVTSVHAEDGVTWSDIKQGSKEVWGDVKEGSKKAWGTVKGESKEIASEVKEGGKEIGTEVKEGGKEIGGEVKKESKGAWQSIKDFFGGGER